VLLDATRALLERDPTLRFVLPTPDDRNVEALRLRVQRHHLAAHVTVTTSGRDAMRAADLLLLAAGTASLEATLLQVPMVVVYKGSGVTFARVSALRRLGLFGWDPIAAPNLLLGRGTVPEFVQREARADTLAAEAWSLLSSQERMAAMSVALGRASTRVSGSGSLARSAQIIFRQSSRQAVSRNPALQQEPGEA
jgi:lipid-A-disaccharide synthase